MNIVHNILQVQNARIRTFVFTFHNCWFVLFCFACNSNVEGWFEVNSPRKCVVVCSYKNLFREVLGWCTLEHGLSPSGNVCYRSCQGHVVKCCALFINLLLIKCPRSSLLVCCVGSPWCLTVAQLDMRFLPIYKHLGTQNYSSQLFVI